MLINEYMIDNFNISIYDSINDISPTIWDKTIAYENPARSHSFLWAVEQSFTSRMYRYFIVKSVHDTNIVGIFFGTKDRLDLLSNLPKVLQYCSLKIRFLFPKFGSISISMLGSYETIGKHWWFASSISGEVAMNIIVKTISYEFVESSIVIIRDIDKNSSDFNIYDNYLSLKKFHRCNSLPNAIIILERIGWSQHCKRLKAHSRTSLTHTIKQFTKSNFSIQYYSNVNSSIEELSVLIQELYPLYLNIHYKAQEFKREAVPLSFFYNLIKTCDIILSVMIDSYGNKVAFIISTISAKVINPFFFGRKKIEYTKINPYVTLLFDLFDKYVTDKTEIIDLGVTNYHIKQTFGAILINSSVYIRFSNNFFNYYLGSGITKFFDLKQPIERETLKKYSISNKDKILKE